MQQKQRYDRFYSWLNLVLTLPTMQLDRSPVRNLHLCTMNNKLWLLLGIHVCLFPFQALSIIYN